MGQIKCRLPGGLLKTRRCFIADKKFKVKMLWRFHLKLFIVGRIDPVECAKRAK